MGNICPQLWRIHINTSSTSNGDPHHFCVEQSIVGVGWAVGEANKMPWDQYWALADEVYYKQKDKGIWPAINAIKNRMRANDLCWMRDLCGVYWLGRILDDDWSYCGDKTHRAYDVVNIRKCKWFRIGPVASVPGRVIYSFIQRRAVQLINCPTSAAFSMFMWNGNDSDDHEYCLGMGTSADLYTLLSSDDCEDLVGIYLQEKGYRIIPSTCKFNTAVYEYQLIHREDGHSAVVQVKNRQDPLNLEDYAGIADRIYLFAPQGGFCGKAGPNVLMIDRQTIDDFIKQNPSLLPVRINNFVKMQAHISVQAHL